MINTISYYPFISVCAESIPWSYNPGVRSAILSPHRAEFSAIIRVELEYPFLPKYSDEQIKAMMQLIELPENYKENSYKFIKIIND